MAVHARQLELYDGHLPTAVERRHVVERPTVAACTRCRAKQARYGFRDGEGFDLPRTLCFECFRLEIARRQADAARLARSRHVEQMELPLFDRWHHADVRRRRAQIAVRYALGMR